MAGKIYNLGNSRSPMLFRKKKNKSKDMSRSLDDLMSSSFDKDNGGLTASGVEWPELASVKKVGPVVMCILPPFSADFVCSALLSLGATPLITDNQQDIVKDLRNCRAVVVDISAPTHLIHALMDAFDPTGDVFMVVAATQVGSNDRKRDLTVKIIDKCGPALVTGRLADIYALGQVIVERGASSDSDDEKECGTHPQISIDHSPPSNGRKASAPDPQIPTRFRHNSPRRESMGDLSPHASPRASPRASPHNSPRASPIGIKKAKKIGGFRPIGRAATIHPRVNMKGQFQDNSMLEVNVDDALQNGHRLAAYTRASIYLYETSILTDGETDIEILNTQPGTQYLHSLLPCSAAIAAACVSSVRRETEDNEDTQLHQFSHAMALWCVAIEEAGNHANQKGHTLPGTMRQALIDALHYLQESHVRKKAQLSLYCMRTTGRK